MEDSPPFALFVRGESDLIFTLSDELGFSDDMEALALSIFEDDPVNDIFHLQALFSEHSQAESALAALTLPSNTEAFVTQLPDEDWVALSQKGLPPVDAGRFWIFGSHDKDNIPASVTWPIHIEAGAAFGTGHHGTTKGCLLIFDELLKQEHKIDAVLDLGCGAGVLAIAAAMALDHQIEASDIDPDAVTVTTDNAVQNGVADHINVFQADGFDSPNLANRSFDLIFANILADPLMGLAPDIATALKPQGHVILSGILDEQAGNVAQAFESQGLTIKKGPSLAGWTSLLGVNA